MAYVLKVVVEDLIKRVRKCRGVEVCSRVRDMVRVIIRDEIMVENRFDYRKIKLRF